ncbi:MAG TPA: hypothetical protein VMX55_02730 [candidate division Zixibacteria bacterium]|nr:hypothetical protein [candidate division Zixibacteria bacterium]
MKKKLIFSVFILTLMLTLPAFTGKAAISPEELYQSNLSANSNEQGRSIVQQDETFQIDNTEIGIANPTEELTQVTLNNTYRVDIEQKVDSFQVNFTELGSTMMFAQADALLISMDVSTDETQTNLDLLLPSG